MLPFSPADVTAAVSLLLTGFTIITALIPALFFGRG
jgi:hypothetical protein